jgi:hypothetical protein
VFGGLQIGFNAPIENVLVGVEAFTLNEMGTSLNVEVSNDGGETWFSINLELPVGDTDEVVWLDFTGFTEWTSDMFQNEQFLIKLAEWPPLWGVYVDYLALSVVFSDFYAASAEFSGRLVEPELIENCGYEIAVKFSENALVTVEVADYQTERYVTIFSGDVSAGDLLIAQDFVDPDYLQEDGTWLVRVNSTTENPHFADFDQIKWQATTVGYWLEHNVNHSGEWYLGYFFMILAFASLVILFYLVLRAMKITLRGRGW